MLCVSLPHQNINRSKLSFGKMGNNHGVSEERKKKYPKKDEEENLVGEFVAFSSFHFSSGSAHRVLFFLSFFFSF